MEKVTISVRIDKDVKEQFEIACKSMGLNISDAINIFARKVVSEQAIPFEVKLKRDKNC
ncbi:MAG: type II toxin-antitoxin system RelB/DinJ family antitoxin [Clostridia bacterium]|nr:type II toxin-antitoxin system RelB/DinJ family antitoxin [Clostridia bacterium]